MAIFSALLRPDIPKEMYLCITDHLPLHSLVALTFTNKRLVHIFGDKHFTTLKRQPKELASFLLLLERDLEDYYYSHPILRKRIPGSTPKNYHQEYPISDPAYTVLTTTFAFTLTSSHLILALKHHSYGSNHGLPLSALTHSTRATISSEIDSSHSLSINLSILPRIVSARLLLRCTYEISDATSAGDLEDFDLALCCHTSTSTHNNAWFGSTLSSQLEPDRRRGDSRNTGEECIALESPSSTFVGCCAFCMCDWMLEEREDGGGGVITTWQNFGSREDRNGVWKAAVGGAPTCRVLKYAKGVVSEAFEHESEMYCAEKLEEIEEKM